jgi:hypothetical protein
LAGISAATSLFLPVPDGLAPTALTGTLTVAVGTQSGDVEFSSAGHRLLVVHAAADSGGGMVAFSVPLTGLTPVAGQVRVDVQASLPLDPRFCQGQFLIPEVDLDTMAVAYSGAGTVPSTIAGYLPPFLSLLRVWLPAKPTVAMVEGAIETVDETIARYGADPVQVEVHTSGAGLPNPGPFDLETRDVVFQAGGPYAAVVTSAGGAPLLVMSGDGDPLRHQVDLVVGALVQLVAASQVTASGQFIPRLIPAAEQTFTQLGLANLVLHGEGQLQFQLPFSQSDFGGMVRFVRLHVKGTYTPVPVGAAASLNVFFNDVLVASRLAGRSGSFDVSPVIALPVLARDNTVIVRFQYTPADGVCAQAAVPVDVQLSADASVETKAGVSLPIGFQRLPQVLLPASDCALGALSPDQVSAAIEVFADLQRLARTPIVPRVVTIAQAVALGQTTPAVIVTTDPSQLVALHPTVDLRAVAPQLVINAIGAKVSVGTAAAVAQVFTDQRRHILVVEARADSAPSLGRLVAALGDAAGQPGLRSLEHDVAVLQPNGRLSDVAVHDTLNPPTVGLAAPAPPIRWWEWLAVLPVPLVVVLALVLVWRRRHKQETGATS